MFVINERLLSNIESSLDANFSVLDYSSKIKFFADGQCNGTCKGVCGSCGYCCQLATKDE